MRHAKLAAETARSPLCSESSTLAEYSPSDIARESRGGVFIPPRCRSQDDQVRAVGGFIQVLAASYPRRLSHICCTSVCTSVCTATQSASAPTLLRHDGTRSSNPHSHTHHTPPTTHLLLSGTTLGSAFFSPCTLEPWDLLHLHRPRCLSGLPPPCSLHITPCTLPPTSALIRRQVGSTLCSAQLLFATSTALSLPVTVCSFLDRCCLSLQRAS